MAKKKTAKKRTRKKKPDLSYISEGLRHLATPVTELVPDAENVRLHDDENLEAIRRSLEGFTQVKNVVAQRRKDGTVRVIAGNGTIKAVLALGHEFVAAEIKDWDDKTAKAYAIADNRTNDLSEFDEEALAKQLVELNEQLEDLAVTGYSETDLDELLDELGLGGGLPGGQAGPGDAAGEEVPERYDVIVVCKTEQKQAALLDRLAEEGWECRALVS